LLFKVFHVSGKPGIQALQETLGLELLLNQAFREIFLVRLETKIELSIDFRNGKRESMLISS